MEIDFYTAFMRAADHIESNPGSFAFFETFIPHEECGTIGCALGWVGFYANLADDPDLKKRTSEFLQAIVLNHPRAGHDVFVSVIPPLWGNEEGSFYREITRFAGGPWMSNAKACAQALRAYAEHHFTKPSAKDPALEKLLESLEKEETPAETLTA